MRIKNILFLIISLYSVTALAREDGPIKWGCDKPGLAFPDDDDECDLYVMNNGRRYFIASFSGRSIEHTYIKYRTKDLAEIISGNGPGYSPSFFYEISTRRSSPGFDQVSAIDPEHKLIVDVGLDGAILKSIFEEGNSVNEVLVSDEDVLSNSAVPRDNYDVKFEDNKFHISYEDKDGKAQHKTFNPNDFIK